MKTLVKRMGHPDDIKRRAAKRLGHPERTGTQGELREYLYKLFDWIGPNVHLYQEVVSAISDELRAKGHVDCLLSNPVVARELHDRWEEGYNSGYNSAFSDYFVECGPPQEEKGDDRSKVGGKIRKETK